MKTWDTANSRWVWSAATTLDATYTVYPATLTLQPNTVAGGQGTTQTQSLNPDGTGHATFTLHDPTYYFTNTNTHATSTGWSTTPYALDAAGATNANSQTGPFTLTPPEARTLYPVWQTVKQPAFTSATRQSDNTLTVTGTARPLAAGDTVEVCSSTAGTAAWSNCRTITFDGTTPDGQASQPWTVTGIPTTSDSYYWLRIRLGHQSEHGTTWSTEQYAAGPQSAITYHANTAQGGRGDDQTVTATPSAATGLSTTTTPKPDTMGGTEGYTNTDPHKVFDGWNTDQNATTGDPALNPGRPASTPGGPTDRYAIWRTVPAPSVTGATRQADGTMKITGTSTPLKSGDTVKACTRESSSPLATPTCLTATVPDNPSGTSNAYNGTTPHTWTITLPAAWYTNTTVGAGYTLTATLTTKDQWRGDGTGDVSSTTTESAYTRPAVTLKLDPNPGTGSSQGGSGTLTDASWTGNAQPLWSDAGGTATFTYPSSTGMSAPGKLFQGWADTATATSAAHQPGSTETFTQPTGTRTVTRYAVWKTVAAPTGASASWSHSGGYSNGTTTFAASGLPTEATGWQIRYKAGSSWYWWEAPGNTLTPSDTFATNTAFTPGDVWTAQVRSVATDSAGATVTSAWSGDITGTLPYMTVTLKPGSQQAPGGEATAKGLVDGADHNAYATLPGTVGTKPDGLDFSNWASHPDGSGDSYRQGPAAIPVSAGSADGTGHWTATLYARWSYVSDTPPLRATATSSPDGTGGAATTARSPRSPDWEDGRTAPPCATPSRTTAAPRPAARARRCA
ncbi:hypothetical protein OZX57_08290 [Bifidobacterium sp. ESL0682]|uniref:hypothetical protein n=1 Tax=Bifidobacterium sp. ESL0682 TaxID=2983212 RepID=UPI0023F9B706|nr:hypothetical protein [Bifidobacterium sp. ESL0682]WEV41920.1 hypothetical protein OZX57_08290 [Bifidobacterium sp. ESL0682]